MNEKKWLILWFFIITTIISIVVIFNIYIDSYSILKKDYSKLYREPNQNYIKINYLISNNTKVDSFIFGSSRVGKINPRLFKDGHYYNMTYSEGVPKEHLYNIKLLLKNGYKIKNILIGLDDFSYEVNPESHIEQLLRKPHYQVENVKYNQFEFYSSYFLVRPSFFDTIRVAKQLLINHKYKTSNFDIYDTGLPLVPEYIENSIENNVEKHINDPKFLQPTRYRGDRIEATIEELKEIVDICNDNSINLVVFINPIHKTTYLDTNFDNFQRFKMELSKITSFYDFSGLNKITTNNYYYYETSHYRTIVGDMIANSIVNKGNKEFGILVNKDNILNHLDYLAIQKENYLK
jgi:hypothetical protein